MSKLPREPNPEHLGTQTPDTIPIAQGTELHRIRWSGGDHPSAWDALRRFGPTNARFDHHKRDVDGKPHEQERGIYYAATDVVTALAEVFQEDRIVDRRSERPCLVSFEVTRDINLLDLSGTFPVRAGASMKLMSGSRNHSQNWARGFYESYPDIEGIYYPSSMTNLPVVALFERILNDSPFPEEPLLNLALGDDRLLELIRNACGEIGYDFK